jgi:hypothetical protein
VNFSLPTRAELVAFRKAHDLVYSDVVRDVVRLVAIARLREANFLDEDCVLVGGMALRLRGSDRFTIFDTDSSMRRPPVEPKAVTDGLTLVSDDLEITPGNPAGWGGGKEIVTAKPVAYKAYFAGTATAPLEGEFSLTVNERGLELAPEWFELRTPSYPALEFDPVPSIPVMELNEQTAEKILGWCGNSLAKHYVDVGWIARELTDDLDGPTLRAQCEKKLEVNRKLFSGFADFAGVDDLVPPLRDPDRYLGPMNARGDRRESSLNFVGSGLTLEEAKRHIRNRIVPLLQGSLTAGG